MDVTSQKLDNAYLSSYETLMKANFIDSNLNSYKVETSRLEDNKIHNSAVNISISMESIKLFLNVKSIEFSQKNASTQNLLMNIINNTELYDFLSGKELDSGLSLKSIGYEGKPITELSSNEAKELITDNGFFGIAQTSNRVSSFVIDISNDDVEALQEARKGVIEGFEQAKKMWGGELPEISYKTQERTLDIIDKKIAELLKTDAQKELENTDK